MLIRVSMFDAKFSWMEDVEGRPEIQNEGMKGPFVDPEEPAEK